MPIRLLSAILTTVFLGLLLASTATAATHAIGGGYVDAGPVGEYYDNPDLNGEPLFTRRDIRIDFDWGWKRKPGGSLSWTRLGRLGRDQYSIRWQGGVMARFSETYTITAYADSVRLWIKPAADAAFPAAPQIDHWPGSDSDDYQPQSCQLALTAGVRYDIKVEYRERTGPARMRLLWSSPSTPQEVIQPTAFVGEQPPGRSILAADAMWGASNWNDKDGDRDDPLQYDDDGWPMEDFAFLIRPQDRDLNPGTYLLQFKGQARVSVHLVNGESFVSADGSIDYGDQLDPGEGYDTATNTTTVRMIIPDGEDNCWPNFLDTDRDGPGTAYGTNSGVTDMRLMRPTTLGSSEPHGLDDLFARDSLDAMDRFVTYRWNDVNGNGDVEWDDRKNLRGQGGDTNENHEYKILWCNHSGRDLWIQVPHRASDDYIEKMALLLRYGSDVGGIPYTSEQTDPVHPPLNPNLRVYVEYTNECPWNTAGQYPQSHWVRQKGEDEIAAGSADGQILNYDGSNLTGFSAGKRYFALRTKQISDIFRSVFGDGTMPAPGRLDPRVRPVLMWQYDNSNGTAKSPLFFLDNYFNKTDPASDYTGTPHPVTYYLWGGGAATYYASADRLGIVDDCAFNENAVGGFDNLDLAPGEAVVAPGGTAWRFTGNGGVYHRAARAAGSAGDLGSSTTGVDDYQYRGCRFTVGANDVAVYELGRYVLDGNDGSHQLAIYDAATDKRVTRIDLDLDGVASGGFAWVHTGVLNFIASRKFFSCPYILQAGHSYYLVSEEANGGDAHHTAAAITPPAGITIDGTARGWNDDGTWTWEVGSTADRAFGPVNLKVAPVPVATAGGDLVLGFAQDSKEDRDRKMRSNLSEDYSDQAAFLAGTATAEVEVTFPAAGYYGFIYHLAYKRDQQPYLDTDGDGKTDDEHGKNRPKVYLVDDGTAIDISPDGQGSIRVGNWSYEGYWTKPSIGFDFFGSAPFEIVDAGRTYTLRFQTTGDAGDAVYIDNVVIASVDAMLAGEIPSGGGFAEGQPDVSNWEARVMSQYTYGQSFGLHAMAYEGGWYPGGDANKMPLQFMASYFGDAIVVGERNAVQILARAGLAVATDYTRNFALPDYDHANAADYSRVQAWDQVHATLAPEATNGLPVASTLAASSTFWRKDADRDDQLDAGDWYSWNVIVPATGHYVFKVASTTGGALELLVDEATTVVSGTSGTDLVNSEGVLLTKGLHSLRLKAVSGSFDLIGVYGALPGQDYGPAGLIGDPGNGKIYITLPAVDGIDGFNIYYRKRDESAWTRHNDGLIPASRAGELYTVDGLDNDSTYKLVVTTVSGGAESAYSNEITVAPSADAPLLSWEFADDGGMDTVVCSFHDPFLAEASLTIGDGLSTTANSYYQSDAFGVTGGSVQELTDDVYFATTLAPARGGSFSLEALKFGVFTHRSDTEEHWAVRWSQDGFVTHHDITALSPAMPITGTSLNPGNGREVTADLSAIAALQDCTTATEFRIYYWYSGGSSSGGKGLGKLGHDDVDVQVLGTVLPPQRRITIGVSDALGPLAISIDVDQAAATVTSDAALEVITGVDATRDLAILFLAGGSG